MANFSELRELREALNLSQAEMGGLLGVGQSAYQRWEATPSSPAGRDGLEKAKDIYKKQTKKEWVSPGLGYFQHPGHNPKQADPAHETKVTPELPGVHAATAWRILHEAARAGGADLMAMDVEAVAEILGSIADAVAAGRGDEARLRLVRRAEVLLRAIGKAAP